MIKERDILDALDYANDGYYSYFIPLNHPHSYLIDTRLNLFWSDDRWAIAAEILGYSPRGGGIELQVFYYGNCLNNLEVYNNRNTNSYSVRPIDEASFAKAFPDELLDPNESQLLVRNTRISLSQNKADYERAGINLTEWKSGRIGIEEVGRLLITQHQNLFRATDEELYKSIPRHLSKILVLDEWHHKDFTVEPQRSMSNEAIEAAYKLNSSIGVLQGIGLADLTAAIRAQESRTNQIEMQEWLTNRPSYYETWQQIAKVLATGDTSYYQPTLPPTTHWSNWPESGSL